MCLGLKVTETYSLVETQQKNRTMQLKEKFSKRAQKKYDKMIELRKLQSEDISRISYNGKNHVQYFTQLEFRMKHLKDLKYFKISSAQSNKRVSILNEAHTLSEDDIRNHLAQCKLKDNIRVTHTYRNYFRCIYLSLNRETVQVSVTQIISHFHSNAINFIWWLYKNYRAVSERYIKDTRKEI